jgi:hypothetical protein
MAIRVDADTAVGMLSDIETELESEDSLMATWTVMIV